MCPSHSGKALFDHYLWSVFHLYINNVYISVFITKCWSRQYDFNLETQSHEKTANFEPRLAMNKIVRRTRCHLSYCASVRITTWLGGDSKQPVESNHNPLRPEACALIIELPRFPYYTRHNNNLLNLFLIIHKEYFHAFYICNILLEYFSFKGL